MRRKDREIRDIREIAEIMRRCDVCRIALNDHGYPYIIPLNFGMELSEEGKVTLYFHSALEGYKRGLMEEDSRASFEMDCGHELQYFEERVYCTYAYESVIGRGRISILPEEEKAAALRLLMDHYHPGKEAGFNPAAIPRTLVYKLCAEEICGKRKERKVLDHEKSRDQDS